MGDHDLEHRDERPRPRLCFSRRRHDAFSSVRDPDNITWLEVRRRVLEEAEIFAGRVMNAVDRRRRGTSTGCWHSEIPRKRTASERALASK